MKIFLPVPKFNEIESKLALDTIPSGYVINYIILENKKYVVTGGCGSGKCGWIEFYIYEIIPIEIYKDSLKPLNYAEHFKEVELNNRNRSYTGMLIKCEGIQNVITQKNN